MSRQFVKAATRGTEAGHTAQQSQTFLSRDRLIAQLSRLYRDQSVVVIEARAGQGKSVLAEQFCAQLNKPLARLDFANAHGDVLQDLLRAGHQLIPQASFEAFDQSLDESLKLQSLSKLLTQGGSGAIVWLDSVDVLAGRPTELSLLADFIRQLPASIQLLICLRPIESEALFAAFAQRRVARIEPASLNFSADEIPAYFEMCHGVCLTPRSAGELLRDSQGWPQGLAFLAGAMSGERQRLRAQLDATLSAYVREQVLVRQSQEAQSRLCRLALMDELEPALLTHLGESPERLAYLAQGFSSEQGELHPLCRRALRQLSVTVLDPELRRETFHLAAEFFAEADDFERAARESVHAGDLDRAEAWLAQGGAALLECGGRRGLAEALRAIGSGAMKAYPYALLHRAQYFSQRSPGEARQALEQALHLFTEAGDESAELLTLAELLRQLVLCSGLHGAALPYYERAQLLFQQQINTLNPPALARVAAALAVGSLLLHGEQANAAHWLDRAVGAAQSLNEPRAEMRTRALRAQEQLMIGDLQGARDDIEALNELMPRHREFAAQQAQLRLVELQWLYLSGERGACDRQLNALVELAGELSLERTGAWPWLLCWRMEIALGDGKRDAAATLLRQLLDQPRVTGNAMIRGQFLQYRALLRALEGNVVGARSDAEEAAELRWSAGGHCQILYSHLALGAVYVQLGDWAEAETRLNEAVRGAEQLKLMPLLAGGLLQRACLWLKRGLHDKAESDTRQFLELMRGQRLQRCMAWLPEVASPVLEFAVQRELFPAKARELAAALDLGFDDRGRQVPLLHVRCLGSLEFATNGETRLTQADFTPAQRHLLALLLASPELSLDQSVIQLALWPDSPADKSRSKLDTLLSRLRSLFNKQLAPWKAAPYLVLRRGVLSMINVRVDAQVFRREGSLGAQLAGSRPWEAEWRLRRALWEWQGRFCLGVDTLYSVVDLRERLFDQYSDYCRLFAGLAERGGRDREAASLLMECFQFNSADEELTDRLCGLYAKLRRPDRIAQVVQQHRAAVAQAHRELAVLGAQETLRV